ncbi:hypothetical protein [Achromobacter ruhlandii]|uniref:hypothetical protein n=1 Tax=Achromobacter ruhlandii TaxID=72557 RepID=UPI0007BEF99C|nr:hypothetical protein [Achromobacter ruhlandii]
MCSGTQAGYLRYPLLSAFSESIARELAMDHFFASYGMVSSSSTHLGKAASEMIPSAESRFGFIRLGCP